MVKNKVLFGSRAGELIQDLLFLRWLLRKFSVQLPDHHSSNTVASRQQSRPGHVQCGMQISNTYSRNDGDLSQTHYVTAI